MKQSFIKVTGLFFATTFLLFTFAAQVTFADSTLDESTIEALSGFNHEATSWKSETADTSADKKSVDKGDSFVSADTIKTLDGFRFGIDKTQKASKTVKTQKSNFGEGDAAVNKNVIKTHSSFEF